MLQAKDWKGLRRDKVRQEKRGSENEYLLDTLQSGCPAPSWNAILSSQK